MKFLSSSELDGIRNVSHLILAHWDAITFNATLQIPILCSTFEVSTRIGIHSSPIFIFSHLIFRSQIPRLY